MSAEPWGIDARYQDLDRGLFHLDSAGDLWVWLASRDRWAYITDQGEIAEDPLQPHDTTSRFFPVNDATSQFLRRALRL